MDIILKIIIGLLSFFFIFAGSIKILGWQKMIFETQMAFMIKYGLNRQILRLIGVVELVAALAIWSQSTIWGPIGALGIFFTSVGALYFHFRFDTWTDAVPAMITFSLSGIVIFAGKEHFLPYIS